MSSEYQDSISDTQIGGAPDDRIGALPLLKTKLYRPPVTPDLEQRTRLIERLERKRQRPMTLISAPAGYGKTMLASMWLESSDCPSTWLSLDETDDDLATFLNYLLAAVHCAFPDIALKTQSILGMPTVPPAPVLARYLLNDLEQIQEPFILALDDIHRLHERCIFELLELLLQHPNPYLHLVLIGRHDPDLPIASLRARQQVTEIRAQDLRFTPQETAGLLSRMLDRQIDETVAADWARITEGWVTALRLAALSLRHRGRVDELQVSIPGDSRYLRDYLLAEVLGNLPDAKQAWILKTAVMERFCAQLCEAVCQTDTDPPDLTGEKFIHRLELENLFLVPLDNKHEWFRFHHMFQALLQDMLQIQLNPEEIATLHLRASSWFAENGLIDEALQYALAAGDVESAVQLVEQHRHHLMNTDQWRRLERWMNLLPVDVVAQNPLLMITKAHIALQRGQDMQTITALRIAERQLAELAHGSDLYEMTYSEINGLQAIWAFAFGHPTRAISHSENSLERLPRKAMHHRCIATAAKTLGLQMIGDLNGAVSVIRETLEEFTWPDGMQAKMMHYLCLAYYLEGDLASVITSARSGLWIMEKFPYPETLSWLRYDLGTAFYLRNEFAQAEPVLQVLLENLAISAPNYAANGSFALALIHLAQGRPAGATQILDRLEEHFRESQDTIALAATEAFRVEVDLRQGNLVKAQRLNRSIEYELRPPIWFFYVPQLTSIKLLLAEDTPESLEEAHARLNALDESMRVINRKNVRIEVLVLQALGFAAQGDEPVALEKLHAALELGVLGGNIRSFVDLGTPMANLLVRLKEQETSNEYSEYIERILAAFPDEVGVEISAASASLSTGNQPQYRSLNESLTRREFQVLRMLCTDHSMQEIAAKLSISTGTLHVHTKNIYRKLNAHKRREAVQYAREFGLI